MWQQWLNDLFHFVSNHIEIQFIHILSCDFESNRIRDCEHLGLRQRLTTSETDQQWHWGSWQRWSVNCWRRVLSVNNRHLLADDFARGYTSMGFRALKSDATDLPHSSFELLHPKSWPDVKSLASTSFESENAPEVVCNFELPTNLSFWDNSPG